MSASIKLKPSKTPLSRYGFVHPLVKQTAVECAQAVYEALASRSNQWYAQNRNREVWVGRRWRDFIQVARQNLAKMLAQAHVDKATKDQIADALIKDNELRLGRARGQQREIRNGR